MATSVEQTPDGRRLVVSRQVDADRETVWNLLVDTERWPEWGASVRAVESEHRYIETGTTGRVEIPGGIRLPFEISHCESYRWTWEVARIPATGHRVRPCDTGCRPAFELSILAAGYAPVCRRALATIGDIASE